jgi:hypothetical protein
MRSPACKKISFSSTDFGGGHGEDAGTDLFVMTEVGASGREFRFGTAGYTMVGGKTIGFILGEAIHGTIIISLMLI